jgi:hypothetical protein
MRYHDKTTLEIEVYGWGIGDDNDIVDAAPLFLLAMK